MASMSSNPAGEDAASDVIAFLERRFSEHRECDDGWYSCPKSESYLRGDGDTSCDCGKDEADALLLRLKSERSFT